MKLHCFHVREADRNWWVVCDDRGGRVVAGKVGAFRRKAVEKWADLHGGFGVHADGCVIYDGHCSRAKAAATMADLALRGDADERRARILANTREDVTP